MLFSFTVKYLRLLKGIPLVPHLFDALMKLWLLVSDRGIFDSIDAIEAEVSGWEGAQIALHKYGGLQFNYRGVEVGHIHGNGVLDIRFSRKTKQQLKLEGKVRDHHVFTRAGWISLYITKIEDADYAINLLKLAYAIKAGADKVPAL